MHKAAPPVTAAATALTTFPGPRVIAGRPVSTAAVVQITAAGAHACARHADGAVSCWGENAAGQLGDPEVLDPLAAHDKRAVRDRPVGAPLGDALEVATGADRTCVRRKDGVWCWGSPAGEPEHIAGVDDATRITSDCAVGATGTVACWYGLQAADPEPGPADAVDVATDGTTTCVLRARGKILCRAPSSSDERISVADAVRVVVHGGARCALTSDGLAYCWDATSDEDLVLRSVGHNGRSPPRIGLDDVAQVVLGEDFGCARRTDGAVACWGMVPSREPGPDNDSDRVDPRHPERVPDLVADEIAAGDRFMCARTGGDVACWGRNERGELGTGWSHIHAEPLVVPGITDAVAVHVGDQFSCALHAAGGASCWGQVGGQNAVATPYQPTYLLDAVEIAGAGMPCGRNRAGELRCGPIEPPRAVGDAIAVAVTESDGFALHPSGTVATWREIETDAEIAPTQIDDAIAIGVAFEAACFVHRDHTVSCGGRELSGTRDTMIPVDHPERISGLDTATAVAVADDHACAIVAGGAVACWGRGGAGQLGPGTTGARPDAIVVPGVDHVAQIAVGERTTCARRTDGTVLCWGDNDTGLLGDPAALTWTAEPVQIPLTGVVDLSIGEHACAALATGTVMCWGRSDNGQIGTLRSGWSTTPVPVRFR